MTDGQLGLISGLYFALFYCLIAIPVGWLADRTNRVRVLSFACALWSAATVACGFAPTIRSWSRRAWPSVSARRAACRLRTRSSPTTSRRARAARRWACSISGRRSDRRWASRSARRSRPPTAGGPRSSSLGAVGIVTALIVYLFVREPVRGGLDRHARGRRRRFSRPRPFWPTCRMFFSRPVLLRVSLACGATQFVTYASLNFTTLFLMREKGMTLNEIAIYYALLIGIGIGAGHVCLRAADRSVRAALESAPMRFCRRAALALAIPFFVGFVWAPTWPLALAFLAVPDVPQLLLPLAGGRAGAGGSAAARARARRRAAAAGDESHRSRARARRISVPPAISSAPSIRTTRCSSLLYPRAVLRAGGAAASSGSRAY